MIELKAHYDVVIIGGGLSGFTLAISLAALDYQIAVVEAKTNSLNSAKYDEDIKDLRALALSNTSENIYQKLGLWSAIKPHAFPIKHVHVSDKGHFGFARIHAKDYGLQQVGSVVPMSALQNALSQEVKRCENIKVYENTLLQKTCLLENYREVHLQQSKKTIIIKAPLVIAADGTHSKLRPLLNIKHEVFDYKQTAIVANIGSNRLGDFTAYERFTESGPLALLPISQNSYSIVWSLKSNEAKAMMALSNEAFLKALQETFGYRVGRFTWVGSKQNFDLVGLKANHLTAPRAIIMGNAAHTLHPIAGQGFNLSLRDIASLQTVLAKTQNKAALGDADFLTSYQQQRKVDTRFMTNFTHQLVRVFSNNHWPQSTLRNIGLLGLDMSFVKHILAARAMGKPSMLAIF